ncbi:MAG: flagellin [Alphaproteobacteria bacterium]|nr:flagellin [Alphaproteobacteria bacterium]
MPAGQNSLNTNVGAFVALSNLNAVNTRLDRVQDRVSAGLKVIGAVDNASSFAIAQGIRADVKAYGAVSQGIANAKGATGIALAGVNAISDLLGDIQAKITEGMNPGNTTQQQAILQADFNNLVTQINQFISSASYNGRNLLSSGSTNANVLSNIDGTTIAVRGNSQATAAATVLAGQAITSTSVAPVALTRINEARATIATVLGNLGADTRMITFQDEFLTKLTDAQEVGLGSIVDADMAKESAKLQALQVQQQLSLQTLNIANQRLTVLLSLFQ